MGCEICDRLAAVGRGEHPWVIAELGETVVVLGDNQGAAGWCVALLKEHVEHLAELPAARQGRVFEEVARVAGAIRGVFGPVRINYECLGNLVGHVHWHVIPRHAGDLTPRATVWGWTAEQLRGGKSEADRAALAASLKAAMEGAGGTL